MESLIITHFSTPLAEYIINIPLICPYNSSGDAFQEVICPDRAREEFNSNECGQYSFFVFWPPLLSLPYFG